MTTYTSVISVSETMAVLIRSMGKYIHGRISTTEGKEAFRLVIIEAIHHVSSGWENVDIIKARIRSIKGETDHLYPKGFFNKRLEERRCHEMAVDLTLDVVNSLNARFLTGQSDDAPRNYRNKGILLSNSEDIFNPLKKDII